MYFLFVLMLMAHADDKLDLQPHSVFIPEAGEKRLEKSMVITHEREVTISGTRFRQIEMNGEVFQIRADQPESFSNCTRETFPTDMYTFEASAKVARRTHVFVEGLRAHCEPNAHAIIVDPSLDGNIGVKFDPEKPGGSEKKIMVNPIKKSTTLQSTF